ncbi:MAG TPA: hypothetical protein VKZ58_02175 [Longimicrobiales bacterium]|nr:hypothetical protein [Longimicrobiales bacterium]
MQRHRSRLMDGYGRLGAEWERVGSRLMSGVCHFFNDRLMVVLGTLDLREELEGDLSEDLRLIRGEMDRIQQAVGSVSAVFRLPGGEREPIWLGDLAAEIAAAHGYRRDTEHVRVEAREDAPVIMVSVDLPLLYRASLMLLDWTGSSVKGVPGAEITISYGEDCGAPALWIGARTSVAGSFGVGRLAWLDRDSGVDASRQDGWTANFVALQQYLADAGVELAMVDPVASDGGLIRFVLRFREGVDPAE